ncbi:MAG: ABC transporter ATP-binding protein [Actinomycetota bacterium]|nr:ABC transporter ATP-binding protein [Actinomycetota bacterium]
MSHPPALAVDGLRVTYPGPPPVQALDAISLAVHSGECLGVVGESGSGKSTLARAALGLLGDARVEGSMELAGLDLASLDENGWRQVRWRRLSLAFQSTTALNPVLRTGDQVAEPLQVHLGLAHRPARERAEELLDDVGLGAWAVARFPRELSGGQQRLALVAVAAACDPEVIILDEPTAGLDPVTRERLLGFLRRLRSGGTSLVVLSHDAVAVADLADRVAVLYRGWVAETGPAARVLDEPRHPYSQPLLASQPALGTVKELRGIRGEPPSPTEVAVGCPFLDRCTQSIDSCHPARPPLLPPPGEDGQRVVACVRAGLVTVLEARGLRKAYRSGTGGARRERHPAVDGVSIDVREGEVVGLVGATGAGKSTLARLLVRLLEPDEGTVHVEGRDLLAAGGPEIKAIRRRVQLLFQDPFEALSPRLTVAEAVREPLDVQELGGNAEREERVRQALASVRVPPDQSVLGRRSHELSGGQLQRVALARALVLEPKLLVADEPVSMLDPSEQAKMLRLLKDIQVERGMAMVLISHDLAVVLRAADRVLVLEHGKVVEESSGTRLLLRPRHRSTRALLAAAGWALDHDAAPGVTPSIDHDKPRAERNQTKWVDAGTS